MENFVKTLTVIADLCGYTLTEEIVALYVHHLQESDLNLAAAALQRMSRSLKPGKGFPSCDDILAEMGVSASTDEDKARDAAALVIGAVRKFGSVYDTTRVKEYVGTLGWAIVERQGGWYSVCESLTNANIGMMQAQFRDLGKALCALNKSGELRHVELPSANPEIRKLVEKAAERCTLPK